MTKYAGRAPYPFKAGDNSTGQCSLCGLVFYGERAFDGHRKGEEPQRRCIDPTDPPLTRKGNREPWWIDPSGRWHLGHRMTQETRATLMAKDAAPRRDGRDGTAAQVSLEPSTPVWAVATGCHEEEDA